MKCGIHSVDFGKRWIESRLLLYTSNNLDFMEFMAFLVQILQNYKNKWPWKTWMDLNSFFKVKEYKRCALQLYLDEIRADIERLKQVDSPDARNDMKRNLEIARVRLSDLQNQFWVRNSESFSSDMISFKLVNLIVCFKSSIFVHFSTSAIEWSFQKKWYYRR